MIRTNILSLALVGILLSGSVFAEEFPARLKWAQRVALSTPVTGVVKEVAVRVGERVERGHVLISLDLRAVRAAVTSARANLARTAILLEEARKEEDRAVELYDRTVLSDYERNLATVALRKAEAEHAEAEARLTQARLDLEYSQLKAPFNGLVLNVGINPGEVVISELQPKTLVELAASDRMIASAQVSSPTAARLDEDVTVRVQVRGQTVQADRHQVGLEPLQSGAAVFYPVDVEFSVPQGMILRPGETAVILVD